MIPIVTTATEDAPPAYSESDTMSNRLTEAVIQTHPLPGTTKNGLIIKVKPPISPRDTQLSHVPCDIALVIDVSGSMSADARVPGETDELTGLSVLDLVKHSCLTIMTTMDKKDRLAIVTFSSGSKVLQPLTPMTAANKKKAEAIIAGINIEGATNLWLGLKNGIKLFENEEDTGRVPAVMVLTDGVPNHMCPPQGYVPALKAMGNMIPSISTFGFGFTLRSGLLKSIAELGRGNYSFIPDVGMIGTVFVHAVAALQSTFATNASIRLTYPEYVKLKQTIGSSAEHQQPIHHHEGKNQLTITLGNIQYGQSRDLYLQWESQAGDDKLIPHVNATLQYNRMTAEQHSSTTDCSLLDTSLALSAEEVAYHISRHQICAFLADLFPIDALGEHRTAIEVSCAPNSGPTIEEKQDQLERLIASLPAARFPGDPSCASLLQDLTGAEPLGQVRLALSRLEYFARWGQHYLPSLHGAHVRQLCNSFKDPGPLQYGVDCPLFNKCRDQLNQAFDELPVPTPSNLPPAQPIRGLGFVPRGIDPGDALRSSGMRYSKLHSMSTYNSSGNPCFASGSGVLLSTGEVVSISRLKRGMSVATPKGPRNIKSVIVTPVSMATMVDLDGVLVTPWHPVNVGGDAAGHQWMFPCLIEPAKPLVGYTGTIHSVLLERDKNVDGHAIMLSNGDRGLFWGATLGHGMVRGADARAHSFFGDYDRVVDSLCSLRENADGRVLIGGVKRDPETNLVCGFDNLVARGPNQPRRSPTFVLSV